MRRGCFKGLGDASGLASVGKRVGVQGENEAAWKHELVYTLQCVRETRQKCDATELRTVREARGAGLTWTEIATALGVTRQSAWERLHELEADVDEASTS